MLELLEKEKHFNDVNIGDTYERMVFSLSLGSFSMTQNYSGLYKVVDKVYKPGKPICVEPVVFFPPEAADFYKPDDEETEKYFIILENLSEGDIHMHDKVSVLIDEFVNEYRKCSPTKYRDARIRKIKRNLALVIPRILYGIIFVIWMILMLLLSVVFFTVGIIVCPIFGYLFTGEPIFPNMEKIDELAHIIDYINPDTIW